MDAMEFLLTLFLINAVAEEKSAFEQALQNDAGIRTYESFEVHDGIKYRKVDTGNGIYYLKMLGREGDISDVACDNNFHSPALAEGQVQVYHRTKAFISTIQEYCYTDEQGQRRTGLTLLSREINGGTAVGIQFPDSKGDSLTNKKIYTNPLFKGPNAGFKSDF